MKCKKIEDVLMSFSGKDVQIIVSKKFDYLNELSCNVFNGVISDFKVECVENSMLNVTKISIFLEDGSSLQETLSDDDCEITYGYDVISDIVIIKDNIKEISIM